MFAVVIVGGFVGGVVSGVIGGVVSGVVGDVVGGVVKVVFCRVSFVRVTNKAVGKYAL